MARRGAQNGGKKKLSSRWEHVGRRLTRPIMQLSFYIVLFIGIAFLGYLAVWIEEYRADPNHLEALKLAYATAILAVGAPCLMQLVLGEDKILRGLAIIFIVVNLLLALCVDQHAPNLHWIHMFGRVGLIFAALCWWLANGDDDLFQDRPALDAPSGGDTSRDLPGGDSGVKI